MRRALPPVFAAALLAAAGPGPAQENAVADSWLPASPQRLPRWRGFNLTNKFYRGSPTSDGPFLEEDFRWIHEFGFNFVRLPMDYRTWIVGDDWTQFNEDTLKEIDQAVAWGEKYHIHVMINFHRAPGYTVANPKEERSLWTDPEAQRVCALHWATFARRYRGIPSERLSFNLFNEPAGVSPEDYVRVVTPIVEAIRAEDPDRLIVSDGLQWGQRPCLELAPLGLAQATRGYAPMELTHYQASWVRGERFPMPTWPRFVANGTLASPNKNELSAEARAPLVIDGPFAAPTALRLHVMVVSTRADLVVRADGQEIWRKELVCGPGEGEWKTAEFKEQWQVWQNTYDRDYETVVPAGTQRVEIAVASGDWMQLTEIGLRPEGGEERALPLTTDWNRPPAQLHYDPAAGLTSTQQQGREWLWETMIVPWLEAQKLGIGVMVGEFGAFNKTPHDVTLRWMEDCLRNWQEAGWGWALWNFRGSFGILDSGRADVAYEDFEGHRLDRQMLELLQRY